jgi:hypothetical protein
MKSKCLPACATLMVTLVSAFSISFAADKKQLEAALTAVEANLKAPAGKQYDESIGKEFPEKYLPRIKQCKQSLPADSSIDPFDLFVRVKSDGKIQEVLVYPETQLSNCARTALVDGKLSNPPHDDYWISIHMQPKH